MPGKYLLQTLGCKVNQYESQQLREMLHQLDWLPVPAGEVPDIAVVNTCAVTASALSQSRQTVRRLTRYGCSAVYVVGCGAAADAPAFKRIPGVVGTFDHESDACAALREHLTHSAFDPAGNAAPQPNNAGLSVLYPLLPHRKEGSKIPRPAAAQDAMAVPLSLSILPPPLSVVKQAGPLVDRIDHFAGRQRAYLKIQDGCDAFCSYCIIPRLRPNLRSKPVEVAVAEAESFVRAGYREIIVTGIFLGAYGRDTAVRKRFDSAISPLARLVASLAQVKGLARLRLSSLEPGDVDQSLLDVLASHPVCVPHLHLPLQSGSAEILRRMNRQYTRDEFLDMIDRVRAVFDRPAISTDVIVGFPGETEVDFEASLAVARSVPFVKIHAFPFSPRAGTAAARWSRRFVPASLVKDRMNRLEEVDRASSLAFRRQLVGAEERVIVERDRPFGIEPASAGAEPLSHGDSTNNDSTPTRASGFVNAGTSPPGNGHLYHGRADRYFQVHFEAADLHPGELVPVRIDRVTATRTHATALRPHGARLSLPVLQNVTR